MGKIAVWVLIVSLLVTGCGASNSGSGSLEVRVWDHREAIGDFSELWLTFSTMGIHPAGQPRTEGWIELEPSLKEIDLTQYVEGQAAVIMQTTVEAGPYNAVRLMINQAAGTLTNGRLVEVKVNSETVALDFQVEDSRTTMVGLDLMVLDMSDHPGQTYELHLREATVN